MERMYTRLLHGYERSLRLVLRHRAAMLVVFALVVASTVEMFAVVPKGFVPLEDTDGSGSICGRRRARRSRT